MMKDFLKKGMIALMAVSLLFACVGKETIEIISTDAIRLNQIGFYPDAKKIAIVKADIQNNKFFLLSSDLKDTVMAGRLSEPMSSSYSHGLTRIADFSTFSKPGRYFISVPEVGISYPVTIKKNIHDEVAKASVKGFYFQRASTALPEKYAGIWARPAGHPDNEVLIHASAATEKRPEGTIISSAKGWYDAGDYNKYIVNSGITMGTLLSAYEDFPAYYDKLNLDIPESENQIPDLLDEVLWNLRWMLTMQDPDDGGVYHKLTNPNFDGIVMPADANQEPRYVVQKGTAASLDFAAVMAQSARIFKKFEKVLPGLADSCLIAAQKAWQWSLNHPEVYYDQNKMNEKFSPAIQTGAYGDRNVEDEFIWAASELFITTKDKSYLQKVNLFPDEEMPLPSWGNVRALGYYSILRFKDEIPADNSELLQSGSMLTNKIENMIKKYADDLIEKVADNAYATTMGGRLSDFIWGSSSVAANQGIAMLQAYKITGERMYYEHALGTLDYLLGRNATGYSFLTGYGAKPVRYPHHRPSEANGYDGKPVPGLLAGGPNAQAPRQDKCKGYPADALPGEVYIDEECSYASNEIAINWNAPMAYLAGALEALQ